jgi:hypothetical protein
LGQKYSGVDTWANIETTKQVSKVNMPSEEQVDNAKEYVDANEK